MIDRLKELLFKEVSELYDALKEHRIKVLECLGCSFKTTCYQRFYALYDLIEAAGLEDQFQEWIDNQNKPK